MTFTTEPEGFHSRFEIVGCFVEHEGRILLLHRQDHKPQGDTWGMPAGKSDLAEDAHHAMQRELKEETGIDTPPSSLIDHGIFYNRFNEYDFTYHLFSLKLQQKPQIVINPNEHKQYRWVTPHEALQMNLIEDFDFYIRLCYP